jgi:hypothetical protein
MNDLPSLRHVVWTFLVLTIMGGMGTGGMVGHAQPAVQFETRVSHDSVAVGERFMVTLVATHEPDTEVSFPAPDAGSALFGDLEVLRRTDVSRGERVDSTTYTVTTFVLDSVRVPALPVQVIAGRDTTIRTAPARTVPVVSVVGPDAKAIHGVAPPASFPRPWWTWALLGLVVAGLVAGLAYLWWRRRGEGKTVSMRGRSTDDQTPYEAATSWIRQLEESYDLSDPDAVKPFYVELSNALRVYLAQELGVAAFEGTTREVVEVLRQRPDVPSKAVTRVQAVLQLADLAKFAGIRPTDDDHEKALREARAALDAIEAALRSGRSGKAARDDEASPHSPGPDVVDGVASAA